MTASEVQEIHIAILERDELIRTLVEENRKYRLTLQSVADDSETQGHPEYIGMNRLANYAKLTLKCSDWLDEFEKDERIAKLEAALQYYAQPETYFIDFKNMAGLPTVCVDNGDIARAALEI